MGTAALLGIGWLAASLPMRTDVQFYARVAHRELGPPLFVHLPGPYPALADLLFLLPRALPLPYPMAFSLLAAGALAALVLAVVGGPTSTEPIGGPTSTEPIGGRIFTEPIVVAPRTAPSTEAKTETTVVATEGRTSIGARAVARADPRVLQRGTPRAATRLGDTPRGRLVAYLLLGTVGVALTRFDAFPALFAAVALERARRGRFDSAWAAAILGTLLKVYPALLLPGFAIAERRSSGHWPLRRVIASLAVAGLVVGAQLALAPSSVLAPLRSELDRGTEFSSVAGSLTWLAGGSHLYGDAAARIVAVTSLHAHLAMLVTSVAGAAGVATVLALAWRGRLGLEATSLGVLSFVVLADRTFAPQYLIWLAPLWAQFRLRAAWLAAAALTTIVFPVAPFLVAATHHAIGFGLATGFAALRNALFLGGTLAWLASQAGWSHGSAVARRRGDAEGSGSAQAAEVRDEGATEVRPDPAA
jgi:hypothetical protein